MAREEWLCLWGCIVSPPDSHALLIFLQMNVSPASLANLYEEDFKQDMAALKVGV